MSLRGPLHGIPISLKDQFNLGSFDSTLGDVGDHFSPLMRGQAAEGHGCRYFGQDESAAENYGSFFSPFLYMKRMHLATFPSGLKRKIRY